MIIRSEFLGKGYKWKLRMRNWLREEEMKDLSNDVEERWLGMKGEIG